MLHNTGIVNTRALYSLKWLTLCYVTFTSFSKRMRGTASCFSTLSVLQLEGFTSQSRPQSPRQGLHSDATCSQFHGDSCQSIRRGGPLNAPPHTHTRQLSNWKSKRSVCVESRQTHSHFQTVGPAFPLPPATGLNSHWLGSRPALPAPWGRLPLWPHLEATAGSSSGSGKLPATASVLPNPPFHILFLNFLRMISSSGFWSFF